MKARLLLAGLFALSQAVVLTGAVTAQGSQPPGWHGQTSTSPRHAAVPPSAPGALSLGQPGTSFRYTSSIGVNEHSYISDTAHLNHPVGLFMDGSNNLFVTELFGQRVLKYNSGGANTLVLGQAGLCYNDTYVFCSPRDVAVDGGGNIWVADGNRLAEFDSSGASVQQSPPGNDSTAGTDDTHFNFVNGIAFDSLGRMYVGDTNNQRVQVYTFTVGAPVYSATIGITGVSGGDASHFNQPYRLALDSTDRLYVVDQGNNRLQRCTFSGSWACTTVDTGLNTPGGVAVDGADNVYTADSNNGRIRKCTSLGVCSDFATNTMWFYDLAVDSGNNVYGSAQYEGVVQKYNSSGGLVGTFLGTQFVPYLTDHNHYFQPRVAVDRSDNLIIIEEEGQRLTKLNSAGAFQWSVGVPGVDAADNTHLNYPHGVATDVNGNIYVADNFRVQIFTAGGAYSATLGTGYGTGNYQFGWATGIAVDTQGNIYVSDGSNHRVQIYNHSLVYQATLGVLDVPGSDNGHFNYPIGVEVDTLGNIYVADINNCRVQKFNSSRVYQKTFGVTGSCTDGFADVSAEDVTVDAQGRVYISGWNNRVEVFDSGGAYLTTIGGAWGANSSQFRGASGVAVDSHNNVFVADFANGRIEKFALGVPGWTQANINGFGNVTNAGVYALTTFNSQLYAGMANFNGDGASIWRSPDGHTWTQAGAPNLTSASTPSIPALQVFNGQLYAGTGWNGAPGQLWRSANGTTWTAPVTDGFGDSNNQGIVTLAVFSGTLYAGTSNNNGVQVWRSTTGNPLSWTNVVTAGFNGDTGNVYFNDLAQFGGFLYAATTNGTGAEVWRTANGTVWNQVNVDGFGSADNSEPGGFAVFNGAAYVGTRNNVSGAELFRSSNGTTWDPIAINGFGDLNNQKIQSLLALNGALYAAIDNQVTGVEVWRSADGLNWSQINPDGFGDSGTTGQYIAGMFAFNNQLFVGTGNGTSGGKIWQLLSVLYLPLVRR